MMQRSEVQHASEITQEQFILASQSLHLQRPGCDAVSPVGLYGWRKRCLYFFLLLLLVTMIVNLALTVWIMKVMNFSVPGSPQSASHCMQPVTLTPLNVCGIVTSMSCPTSSLSLSTAAHPPACLDGMGNLQLKQDGIHLEGISEFLLPLYVNEIQSRSDSFLVLRSEKNITLNVRNDQGQLTGQLTVGPEAVEAQCQRVEVRSKDGGRLLFTANEEEVVMTTEKFTITGSEGAMFGHSVETPLIQATASEDLKLESPTRTLTMEAPRGVEVSAAKGPLKVSSRKDLQLESTEGEILLDANTIQLGSLPLGIYTASSSDASQEQAVYEVCVCPSGKIYLSPAESSSTCQAMSNICLWS
ncbi:zeta-sarcoglycan-like isoform X2 [Siniperca chuatsi]|uniref:zeta-sarcoglycan-like isoform X2 n=1 Tax=Siniperca chuatsi TaxID=119488 RepID=UPI001CE0E56E|nr:zeta-sarcoglycan-like isoform X2 [Siniperca chuatsi]